tara:strand:- start:1426 stop:2082 length:657 start_codon:yes stop_codon:yes gene_type:complete
MSEDWASDFRPGAVPEPPVATNESQPEVSVDTEKILLGFEAVVRRLDAMDKRLSLFEQFLANPEWLPNHIETLRQLHQMNAQALMTANQQFSQLVIRKLDEMEERIKSDEPSYTNVLYSNPELFHEISSREDEVVEVEKALDAADALIDDLDEKKESSNEELVELLDEDNDIDVPLEIMEAYESWKDPDADGSWPLFVKACGGPVHAKKWKELIAGSE